MREFLRMQQSQCGVQERQLLEMTTQRLKKQPSNSKFSVLNDKNCNPKNFREWYQKIISILATDEWNLLYNNQMQDVISDGRIHPALNNHLYSALLLVLKDSVEVFIQGMAQLFGDGVAVLHELCTAYKGFLTEIEIMKLQGTLLGDIHFCSRSESVDLHPEQYKCTKTLNTVLLSHLIASRHVLFLALVQNYTKSSKTLTETNWILNGHQWRSKILFSPLVITFVFKLNFAFIVHLIKLLLPPNHPPATKPLHTKITTAMQTIFLKKTVIVVIAFTTPLEMELSKSLPSKKK